MAQDIPARVSHPFLYPSLWCISSYTRENGKSPNLFPRNVGKSPNLFPRNVGKSPNLFSRNVGKSPNLFSRNVGKSPNLFSGNVGKSPNLFPGNVGKSPNLFSENVGKSPNLCPKTLLKDIVFVTQRHASSLPIFVCFVSHTDRYAPFGVSNRHSSIASSSSLRAGAEAAGRLSPSCSAELAPTMTEVTPF